MRIVKDTLKKDILKKYIFVAISFLLLIYFEELIFSQTYIIINNLENINNIFLEVLLLILSAILCIIFFYKLFIDSYLPSFFQKYIGFGILIFYLLLNKKYQIPLAEESEKLLNINYLLYFLLPVFVFCFFYTVLFFSKLSEKYWPSYDRFSSNNYLNDDPIISSKVDLLEYEPKVKNLLKIFNEENFKKSFTVGIVGPWGNGKSSFINMAIEKLKDENKANKVIISFMPYLNHNEDDIINEFFTVFSNQLKKYSGKLSNQFIKYAEKITDAYKSKNPIKIFENHITNTNDMSAIDLYHSINSTLSEIDKQIIVFIDDLDRLTGKEILQVLKLIRNTADFSNTFFVVTMDKDYVLNRLKTENIISSSRFVDKFFQIEIFLPEIDQTKLRDFVYKKLLKSQLITIEGFEANMHKGFNHQDNLFYDYIKNLRDAKRIINQIIFDYVFLKEVIDFKDFMNFTYFKLKFPKFMELLNQNRGYFLELSNGEYKLQTENKAKNQEFNLFDMLGRGFDYSLLVKNYPILSKLKVDDKKLRKKLDIDFYDNLLLLKTLAYLFGEENKVESIGSIKKENNFRMLMEQKTFENVLLESEFKALINQNEKSFIEEYIKRFSAKNKLNQLLNRLDYFDTDDNNKIKRLLNILLRIFNSKDSHEINEYELYEKIFLLIDKLVSQYKTGEKEEKKDKIDTVVFKNEILNENNKLLILCKILESRETKNSWGLDENYLSQIGLELFEKYLEQFNQKSWKVTDFSLYRYYHTLKEIDGTKEELNSRIKEFWTDKKIELLCAQSIEMSSFSLLAFKISNVVDEIFGNKNEFLELIRNQGFKDDKSIKEFLEFFELCEITNFNQFLKFNFKSSELMKKRIEQNANILGRSNYDEYENIAQVILETNSKDFFELVKNNKELFEIAPYSIYTKENTYYLLINFNVETLEKSLLLFKEKIHKVISRDFSIEFLNKNVLIMNKFIKSDDKKQYFEIRSIQK